MDEEGDGEGGMNWEGTLLYVLLCVKWASQVALAVKEPACQWRRHKRCRFNPWVGKTP